MIKVSELTGAALDYYVAKAESHTAIVLFDECVVRHGGYHDEIQYCKYAPSTDWAQGGPLIEKYELCVGESRGWFAGEIALGEFYTGRAPGEGDTPLQAICRAVVRAAFGDEVEEVA